MYIAFIYDTVPVLQEKTEKTAKEQGKTNLERKMHNAHAELF
jgi:hypothetical protein